MAEHNPGVFVHILIKVGHIPPVTVLSSSDCILDDGDNDDDAFI